MVRLSEREGLENKREEKRVGRGSEMCSGVGPAVYLNLKPLHQIHF